MLRKLFSLGALVVVALAFGVGNAAAKGGNPPAKPGCHFSQDGFSDGRDSGGSSSDGFSDGRI
jgi:hypothetical protein